MSYMRESGLRRFLRKLFTATAAIRRETQGSAAAPPPPLHVEHGPSTPRRNRKRR